MARSEIERQLDWILSALELDLDSAAREKLLRHEALLRQWNRRLNLTRISAPREVAERHFGESLFLARQLDLTERERVADIGSGAGFPGLPIAVLAPQCSVTLAEPVVKKAVFLREVSRDWGNVRVETERAEALEGEWDWTVMRAVRLGDVAEDLVRLAPRTAILCGEAAAAEAAKFEAFAWEAPQPTPWGERRYLLTGRRST